ncbi:hypothetical protein MRX96_030916 [Rhipicephalus microplus]
MALTTDAVGVVLIDSASGRVRSSSRKARGHLHQRPHKNRADSAENKHSVDNGSLATHTECVPITRSQCHDPDGAALLMEAGETPSLKGVGVAFNARLDSRSWSAIFPQVLGIHL